MRSVFLAEYLKNIRSVGAVAPSSRYLARKMLETVDFAQAEVIVEFGPGTGVFTAELARRMKPGARLLVIETNPTFHQILRDEYAGVKGVEVINESAEHVGSLLKARHLRAPDYIVSGLPFAALPAETSHAILATAAGLLGSKGTFITFQYTLLKKALLASYFSDIQLTREFRNLPPAYVLCCREGSTSTTTR